MNLAVQFHNCLIYRNIKIVFLDCKANKLVACFLQFRSHDIAMLCNIYCKGYQCRRYIDIIEGTGHTVLTTDGRQSEADLCIISTKQCCKRLAPTLRIGGHSAEVLLEGETNLAVVTAGCYDLSHRFHYCIDSAMVRAPGRKVRIESVTHHGYSIGLAL